MTVAASVDVLIAEDSATQAERLRHTLEQNGYTVTIASNGRLALESALRTMPRLVLSDVVMPEMDGYELCRRIKADQNLREIPVILVTTLSDPHDVIRGLECGADNFVLKPYEPEHLLRRVEFVLVNSRMRENEHTGMGLGIVFAGQRHFITADRLQILNLLLSTYEAAIYRNKELSTTRDALRQTNQELEQLARELEDRVLARTRELERSNEALRQAQQALIQQERLSALGQMASGIAHDINNAISPIALYTESLLNSESNLSARARDQLVVIQRAIDDVAQTVGRMREFYRPRELEAQLTEVALNALVQQVIDLTHARWSDQPQRRGVMIDLKAVLATDLPTIRGADNELRDALTNLIFNAVDAMPQGGVIEVRTSSLTSALGTRDAPGGYVRLEVSDSGIGMDEETRRRCLEPFFTTKGERGTGLGLAMVYGMAQRHGAELDIDSRPGAGTTVRLLFPISAAASATSRVIPAQVPHRTVSILVVDDEPALLDALRNALQLEGHRVTVADGGRAGIEAFSKAQGDNQPFDIVITDLGMPNVDGRQVVSHVRAASPSTPIILLTGWSQHVAADQDPALRADRLLGKPPRLPDLRTAIAELTASHKT